VQEADKVQEARSHRRTRYNEQKEESRSLLSGEGQPRGPQSRPQEKAMPVKSEKIANRNDKVTVQYTDGRVVKDVKYKKVEEDIKNNRCIIID
jgi:preprotein translocase subunit SecA